MLAIDPSMNALGWCLDNGITTKFGTMSFSQYRNDYGSLFHAYEKWLVNMICHHKIKHVAIEGVNAGLKGHARYIIGGMDAVTHKAAFGLGCKRTSVSPSELKFWLTGKGNASKSEVIQAISKRGYSPKDDNQADAIGIMLLAKEKTNERLQQSTTTKPTMEQQRAQTGTKPKRGLRKAKPVRSRKGNGDSDSNARDAKHHSPDQQVPNRDLRDKDQPVRPKPSRDRQGVQASTTTSTKTSGKLAAASAKPRTATTTKQLATATTASSTTKPTSTGPKAPTAD